MAKQLSKIQLLYNIRDKNYTKDSPHYVTLTKLIKAGDDEKLKEFGTEHFVEGPQLDEFNAVVAKTSKSSLPAPELGSKEEDETLLESSEEDEAPF